ncbi:MAG: nucleoside triphosphate pyrophosphohydrolase [Candidatus Pacebacteria bacterium]|nr:nucleoside triphosphate pyrophosphohydrolase [Candidatus Paceibacterota bacterium]
METYNKLVRDRIPEIIERDGKRAKTRVLNDEDYKLELLRKLMEEAQETLKTEGDKKELTKEVGDIIEIIGYLIKIFELDPKEIEKIKLERRESRGGFDKKLFLEYVE